MKKQERSFETKKALSEALKQEMGRKSLSRITVSDLIRICNINRNIFYYHFADIYDLLKWTMEQEALEVVKKINLLVNTEEAIRFVLDYVDKNKHIIACAYDSMGHEEIKRFFYTDIISIVNGAIDEAEREYQVQLETGFKEFVAMFFTEAIAGCLINYIKAREKPDRERVINNLLLIYRSALRQLLSQSGGQPEDHDDLPAK